MFTNTERAFLLHVLDRAEDDFASQAQHGDYAPSEQAMFTTKLQALRDKLEDACDCTDGTLTMLSANAEAIPGWTPVQRCDSCQRYETDGKAAVARAGDPAEVICVEYFTKAEQTDGWPEVRQYYVRANPRDGMLDLSAIDSMLYDMRGYVDDWLQATDEEMRESVASNMLDTLESMIFEIQV